MDTTMKQFAVAVAILGALAYAVLNPAPARAADYTNYMAFGDSITAGIGTTNPATDSYGDQANIRAFGIGGSCAVTASCSDLDHAVQYWWPRYIDAMAHPPKVAVFMIGTNDYPKSSAAQIENAMRILQDIGAARGIRVVFGTITPAPAGNFWNVGWTGVAKQTRLAVNDWIRDHPRLRGPEYARALSCGAQDLCPEYIGPLNDVHVNNYGAAVMGNVLRAWVEADR